MISMDGQLQLPCHNFARWNLYSFYAAALWPGHLFHPASISGEMFPYRFVFSRLLVLVRFSIYPICLLCSPNRRQSHLPRRSNSTFSKPYGLFADHFGAVPHYSRARPFLGQNSSAYSCGAKDQYNAVELPLLS